MHPFIYVSAPMRGIKGSNEKIFNAAGCRLKGLNCRPILPPAIAAAFPNSNLNELLEIDLKTILHKAHAVVVCGNILDIVQSTGCQAEIFTAQAVGKPVFSCYHKKRFNEKKWKNIITKTPFSEWLELWRLGEVE